MNKKIFGKLIIGALYSEPLWLEQAKEQMRKLDWNIQHQSLEVPFDQTDYYASEMGNSLNRCFLSMKGVQALELSAKWKLSTATIEDRLSRTGKRKINLENLIWPTDVNDTEIWKEKSCILKTKR